MLIQLAPLHLGNRIREAFVDAFQDFAVAWDFSHADDPLASTARKNMLAAFGSEIWQRLLHAMLCPVPSCLP